LLELKKILLKNLTMSMRVKTLKELAELRKKIGELEELTKIVAKSKMTEKEALKLGKMINKGLAKRYEIYEVNLKKLACCYFQNRFFAC